MDGGESILNVGRVVETFAVSSPHTRDALELDRNLRLATKVPPYYALPYSRELRLRLAVALAEKKLA